MVYSIIAVLIAAVCLGAAYLWYQNSRKDNTADIVLNQPFKKSQQAIANPLTGFAPRADGSGVSEDISLVYIDVYWSKLEPAEGEYDWEAIENTYQFERWRNEGKHAVFRFIMDYPTDQAHRDIPDWLYDKTGDGTNYSNSYGKGYSPNYSNKKLLAAYQKTVSAIGKRWGSKDTFVSFVQLGGLGHWGEWHTELRRKANGAIPKESIREQYVEPWMEAFPKAQLMMRRPFNIAAEEELGLFNDMFGKADETNEWLDWIHDGGSYDQTKEKEALSPMPNFWKTAPSGGEIASDVDMSQLMERDISHTAKYLQKSHTTFLGPMIADRSVSQDGYDTMRKNMGYRLWISDVKATSNNKAIITWKNAGTAPFYWKWPVKIYVETQDGKTKMLDSNFDIRTVLPDKSQTMTVSLNKKLAKNWKTISIAIQDPMTDQDAVHFAIDGLEAYTRIPILQNKERG